MSAVKTPRLSRPNTTKPFTSRESVQSLDPITFHPSRRPFFPHALVTEETTPSLRRQILLFSFYMGCSCNAEVLPANCGNAAIILRGRKASVADSMNSGDDGLLAVGVLRLRSAALRPYSAQDDAGLLSWLKAHKLEHRTAADHTVT